MSKILLCVSGSISAYKSPSIANALASQGHSVKVILTNSAKEFITKLSFSSQGFKTYDDQDDFNSDGVLHIELIRWADTVLVAPMSANTLAKISGGFADNLLTTSLRAADWKKQKLVFCPAMNTNMFLHPITQMQMDILKTWGGKEIVPVSKKLACGEYGIGALAPISDILCGI